MTATTSTLRDHAPRELPAPVHEAPPATRAKPRLPRILQRRSTQVFAGLTALADLKETLSQERALLYGVTSNGGLTQDKLPAKVRAILDAVATMPKRRR